MYDVGYVFRIREESFVVAARLRRSLLTFRCSWTGGNFHIDSEHQVEWTDDELQQLDVHAAGQIEADDLDVLHRAQVFHQVGAYYRRFHQASTFIPGKSFVPYAGKVYDEQDLVSLTDAALDFWLTAGRYTERFERALAQYLGVRYVLVTNSGSSANLLAVTALTSPMLGSRRLLPGDEVITVAAGFPTTVAPIVQNGLIPVFVDVQLGTYNVCVEELEAAVSPRTKAIVLAHTMGNPFNLDAVLQVAEKHGLWLVEDNCDALGSRYRGRPTGTFGDIGTSSFYPAHHITMGEGGAVYTRNPLLKRALASFRDWGRDCWCASGRDNTCGKRYGWQLGQLPAGYDHKYTYSHLGYNLKATDMQAAVGLSQLQKLPEFTERRIRNFQRLRRQLQAAGMEEDFILPEATEHGDPSWFGFVLTLRRGREREGGSGLTRQAIVQYLEQKRIQTRMLFAGNIVRQPAFADVEYRISSPLTNTDKIMKDTFLVGVYPGLTDEMVDYIAVNIIEAVRLAKGQR